MLKKLKYLFENEQVFMTILIILVGISSFFLGRLSVIGGATEAPLSTSRVTITNDAFKATAIESSPSIPLVKETTAPATSGEYVVSKSGTKYHHITCPGAKQIKEENKIFFATKEEAAAAGYSQAANCTR